MWTRKSFQNITNFNFLLSKAWATIDFYSSYKIISLLLNNDSGAKYFKCADENKYITAKFFD